MPRTESLCRTTRSERIASWATNPWRVSPKSSTVHFSNRPTSPNAQSWDYDAVGNWDSVTTNSTTQTRGANRQNEITSVSGATTPTYDNNGNLTKDENDNRLVWDAWNMMVQVKNSSNVVIVTMGRDALHRHVTDTEGTSLKDRFFGLKWQLFETKAGSNTVSRNVWSPAYVDGMVLRDRDTDSNGTLDERIYPLQDANWNTTALVNASGTVVERETYGPFGVATYRDPSGSALSGSSKDWVFLHQGGEKIAAGDYEFRNRVLSPTFGRWLSNDPIGFGAGDVNTYRYIANNSIKGQDPSGLDWWEWIPVAGTIGHAFFVTVPGAKPEEYASAKPSAADCKKDRDLAEKKCSDEIIKLTMGNISKWTGSDFFIGDAFESIGGLIAAAIGKYAIKNGYKGAAITTGVGVVLVIDGIVDFGIVVNGINAISKAATSATESYCKCKC